MQDTNQTQQPTLDLVLSEESSECVGVGNDSEETPSFERHLTRTLRPEGDGSSPEQAGSSPRKPLSSGPSAPLKIAVPARDRYEDLGRIGKGGMGEVRRVHDAALDRVLAMKIQGWDALDSPHDRARFLAEVRITAALQHPGIVPIHDWGELPDGRLWFAMKEVRGRTLRDHIAALHETREAVGSPRALRRLCDALLRVSETVAYAHSRRVIHRDLKPDNIMIGEFGEVMVMDWGLARRLDTTEVSGIRAVMHDMHDTMDELDELESIGDLRLTRPGQLLGTPAYMAPEQARGEHDKLGLTTDVYALGAILYEILAGRPPYVGSTALVFSLLRSGSPPRLEPGPHVPRELVAICERAMAREAHERFEDAAVFAEPLRAFLEGAQRRERALAIVGHAREMTPRIEAMRTRAQKLRTEARTQLGCLSTFADVADKAPGWRLEAEAEKLERDASVEEVTWLQTLRSALNEAPDLAEAHDALAEYYASELSAAEATRDAAAAARNETLLRIHDRGRYAALLRGEGTLDLLTDPEGAEVFVSRYVERDRRLVLDDRRELGRSPLRRVVLPRGSYLLVVRAPGCLETRVPVLIERGAHAHGIRPGARDAQAIYLPREGELGEDEIYVPGSWFLSGGDPIAPESLPRRRLWVDGFVVQKNPVTVGEYLEFLNALVAIGQETEAVAACPRVARGRAAPGEDVLAYRRDHEGRFELQSQGEAARLEMHSPVAFIDWRSAMGYARWFSEKTGLSWRLLNELEWEKAARGVDGRTRPWGDYAEPTWACLLGSSAEVPGKVAVDDYPMDESPYGVRGMTGNVRDYCINAWKYEGPLIEDQIVQLDAAADDDPTLRAVRGGAWTSAPEHAGAAGRFAAAPTERFGGLGFRLARSLGCQTLAK